MQNLQIDIQDLTHIQQALEGQEKALSAIVQHLQQFNDDAGQFADFQGKFVNTLSNVEKVYVSINGESKTLVGKINEFLDYQKKEYPTVVTQATTTLLNLKESLRVYQGYLTKLEDVGEDFDVKFLGFSEELDEFLNKLDGFVKVNFTDIFDENKAYYEKIVMLASDLKIMLSDADTDFLKFKDSQCEQLTSVDKKIDSLILLDGYIRNSFKSISYEARKLYTNIIAEISDFKDIQNNRTSDILLNIENLKNRPSDIEKQILRGVENHKNKLADLEIQILGIRENNQDQLLVLERKFDTSLRFFDKKIDQLLLELEKERKKKDIKLFLVVVVLACMIIFFR